MKQKLLEYQHLKIWVISKTAYHFCTVLFDFKVNLRLYMQLNKLLFS